MSLGKLAYDERFLDAVQQMLLKQRGCILFTGPAKSGKTTTMYALAELVADLLGESADFATIEQQVERSLPFATQIQLDPESGLTMPVALDAVMQYRPKALLISGLDDPAVAYRAVRAGMEGHLVIAAVTAASTADVIVALCRIPIERYVIASSVMGVINLRLVETLQQEGVEQGMSGKLPLAEVLLMNEDLERNVCRVRDFDKLAAILAENMHITFRESAETLIVAGAVSPEEIDAVLK